jgi:hypothetical protein
MSEENSIKRALKLASKLELGNPDVAGKSLAEISKFLLKRIPEHKRPDAIRKMIIKLRIMNAEEIADKDMKDYSSMGQSLSFIKNVLAGNDKDYIRRVLDAIIRNMVW